MTLPPADNAIAADRPPRGHASIVAAGWIAAIAAIADVLIAVVSYATESFVGVVLAATLLAVTGIGIGVVAWRARTARWSAAMAVVGVALAMTGAGIGGGAVNWPVSGSGERPDTTGPPESAVCAASPRASTESAGRICSPANGARIEQAIVATGKAANIPAGHELWLFVEPVNSEKYLPGNGMWAGTEQSTLRVDNGQWGQGDLEFGSAGDPPGGQFNLALVDVGPDGVKLLRAYLAGPDRNGIDRGHILATGGTRLLDTIRLERA